jgi:cyclopropane fatty-acyl-phospholipid synthase-like methyltransferase
MENDLYGNALQDFQNNNYSENLSTYSSITEDDEMALPYLFRTFKEMPLIEQKALEVATGKILDIGAGAGSHSLYLQKQKKEITAIDISEGAIDVCMLRGIQNVLLQNIWDVKNQKFDTLLALMNGTGICGKLEKLGPFLLHLKSLLTQKGQILIDSSDIIYMFEDENGDHWIDADTAYYGEVTFQMGYKNKKTAIFDWLYVDYNTLQRCANYNGLHCELLQEGEHYDYLAKLTHL